MPGALAESTTGAAEEHAVISVQISRHATIVPFPIAPTSCALHAPTGTRAVGRSREMRQL